MFNAIIKRPVANKFNDLDEDVIQVIISCLTLTERSALERINQKVGRCCQSLWIQQRFIRGIDVDYSNYMKLVFKCPNLIEFLTVYNNWWKSLNFEPKRIMIQTLAAKCPKLEKMDVSISDLIEYLKFNEYNLIKYWTLDFLKSNSEDERHEHDFGLLYSHLTHLKRIDVKAYDNVPDNMKVVLKRLIDMSNEVSIQCWDYDEMDRELNPGSKLIATVFEHDLNQGIPEKHPKLKDIKGSLNATESNLRILNRLRFLKSVDLIFSPEDNSVTIRALFQAFLSSHADLTKLSVSIATERNSSFGTDLLNDIMERKSDLKFLSYDLDYYFSYSPNLNMNWNLLFNMNRLQSLELISKIDNYLPDVSSILEAIHKLHEIKIHVDSNNLIKIYERQTIDFIKTHPERSNLKFKYSRINY